MLLLPSVLILAPPLSAAGGIQYYTHLLRQALKDIVGAGRVMLYAVPVHRAAADGHTRIGWTLRARFLAGALWRSLRHRPGLIICTHVGVAPVGWLLGRLWRVPYWVVGHGVEVWGALPRWKRKALVEADRVVAVSEFTKRRVVERYRVSEDRVLVIPNTLDDRLLHIEPDKKWLEAWGLTNSHLLLTVGRLASAEQYKGHDVVIRALPHILSLIPDTRYLIIGDGDDRERLQRLAAAVGVADCVIFAGRASDAQLAAAYRACDVFVMPARTVLDDKDPKGEGFGIVFLEAMAFGKPVVGPKVGAPAEFIRHGEHGLLVDPSSPEEVADALVQLLTDREQARQMGEAARTWVRQEFSQEKFQERWMALLSHQLTMSYGCG